MRAYSLTQNSDRELFHRLAELIAQDCRTTAELLAHLAEIDTRKLYVPRGYSSMYDYCVGELRMSEDAACRRIRMARVAREFPAIFVALAEGKINLSSVVLLAPRLNPENAEELLAAASHKSSQEIKQLIAERFPRPDVAEQVRALDSQTGLTHVDPHETLSAPARIESGPRPKIEPLAPQRFALTVTIGQRTHDKLRYAQQLMSHKVPAGNIAEVLDQALDLLIDQLEKRKFAATRKPRPPRKTSDAGDRHVPAHVKRAVWDRDGAQCTFVSDTGHRCSARALVEFDHVDEVARGGRATVERMRLLCHAHNQYAAEQTFGAGFMHEKRTKAQAAARTKKPPEREEVEWLRALGIRADDARNAAAICETMPDAPLEERIKQALASYGRSRYPDRTTPSAVTMQ